MLEKVREGRKIESRVLKAEKAEKSLRHPAIEQYVIHSRVPKRTLLGIPL